MHQKQDLAVLGCAQMKTIAQTSFNKTVINPVTKKAKREEEEEKKDPSVYLKDAFELRTSGTHIPNQPESHPLMPLACRVTLTVCYQLFSLSFAFVTDFSVALQSQRCSVRIMLLLVHIWRLTNHRRVFVRLTISECCHK